MKAFHLCVHLCSSDVCLAYVNHFKAEIASVGCCQWQNRWLSVGVYYGVCWKGKQMYSWSTYECVYRKERFSNGELSLKSKINLHHHNCSPSSFHLTLKRNKTVHYITPSPLSTYCILYIFHIWNLCFLPSAVWFTCTLCSKSNFTKFLLRSQVDTALFTAGHQQKVTECTAVLEPVIHHV